MYQERSGLSTDELTFAIEEDLREFWRMYGHAPQSELYEGTDLLRLYTGVPYAFCNGVICSVLPPDKMDAAIRETVSYYRERNARWEWIVGPGSAPASLEDHLVEHGLSAHGQNWGMAISLQQMKQDLPTIDGFRVVPVEDDATLKIWTKTLIAGFEAPELAPAFASLECSLGLRPESYRRYLGLLNDRPVAVSALRFGESTAGIYCVATVPSARGVGIGGKITHHALLDARALGRVAAVLQSSDLGRSVYRRLGFLDLSVLRSYRPN